MRVRAAIQCWIRRLGRMAFWLARTRPGAACVRLGFSQMSSLLPVHRLAETDTLLAFYHPQPSHAVHIVLAPKRAIASLADLSAADSDFLSDVFETVRRLAADLGLEESGYRLIANGGAYQDVPILHFHLISEKET